MKAIKCECGGSLDIKKAYTGADWNCKAGEGSGYGYEISLECDQCGSIYHLGNVRKDSDFSEAIKKSEVAPTCDNCKFFDDCDPEYQENQANYCEEWEIK